MQRGEQRANLVGQSVPVPRWHAGPRPGRLIALKLRHEDVAPAVGVLTLSVDDGSGDWPPILDVLEDSCLQRAALGEQKTWTP